jgi:hypothetical protein
LVAQRQCHPFPTLKVEVVDTCSDGTHYKVDSINIDVLGLR